jgi:hypothetical protein
LGRDGRLVPHIWSARAPGPNGGYHRYDARSQMIRLRANRRGWFKMLTRIRGHRIQLVHEGRTLFTADMSLSPFRAVYGSVAQKHGNIGFRCFPGEEATIAGVTVREASGTRMTRRAPRVAKRKRT